MRKSHLISIILTLVFGPLGLFYSSIGAALALCLLAIVLAMTTSFMLGVGAFAVWPVAIIVGFFAVNRHNRIVSRDNRRHEELVRATREGQPPK